MTEVIPQDPASFPARRPAPPLWMVRKGLDRCGHCKGGHCRSCKGAVRVPKTRKHPDGLLRCFCQQCNPQVRCLTCGNQFGDDVNPMTWCCYDLAGCAGRIDLRRSSDRVWRMIQESKSAGALARRDRARYLAQTKLQLVDEPEDRVAVRSPRATSGSCECCGVETKGGRFAPGHDARMKSRLKKASDAGDKDAYRQLVERGWVGA